MRRPFPAPCLLAVAAIIGAAITARVRRADRPVDTFWAVAIRAFLAFRAFEAVLAVIAFDRAIVAFDRAVIAFDRAVVAIKPIAALATILPVLSIWPIWPILIPLPVAALV